MIYWTVDPRKGYGTKVIQRASLKKDSHGEPGARFCGLEKMGNDVKGSKKMVMVGWAMGCSLLFLTVVFRAGMTRDGMDKALSRVAGRQVRPIELRVWDWWSPAGNEEYGAYFEEVKAIFEERNPDIDVVYQFVPFGHYVQKLSTAMVGQRPPDVFQSSVYWAEGFYHRGMLRPLNDLLESQPGEGPTSLGESSFMESAWRHNHTGDGVVYGIPQIIDANCLLWNLDILEEEARKDEMIRDLFVRREDGQIDFDRIRFDGIRDWDHFREIVKRLTRFDERGQVKRAGFIIQAYGGGGGLFSPWLASNGGRYQDSEGREALFHLTEGVQAMTFLVELYWEDKVSFPFRRQLSGTELFVERKAACIAGGTWSGKDIARDTQGWTHMGKTAYPPGPMGKAPSTETWGNMLVISSSCLRVDAAWRYIQFVCGKEGNLLRSKHLGYNGPRLDFYETPAWEKSKEDRPYLSNVKEICLSGIKLRHTEIIASDHQANPIFETILLQYPDIREKKQPYESVRNALEQAAGQVNLVYSRYNLQKDRWLAARGETRS